MHNNQPTASFSHFTQQVSIPAAPKSQPGSGTGHLGTIPSDACWNYSNYAILNLLSLPTLPHPSLPMKNVTKALAMHPFSPHASSLTLSGPSKYGSPWHARPPLLGTVINFLFQVSCLCVCHLTTLD